MASRGPMLPRKMILCNFKHNRMGWASDEGGWDAGCRASGGRVSAVGDRLGLVDAGVEAPSAVTEPIPPTAVELVVSRRLERWCQAGSCMRSRNVSRGDRISTST